MIFTNGPSKNYLKRPVEPVNNDNGEQHFFNSPYFPRFATPEKFIDMKIKMLREHFCIKLTDEDEAYLRKFETENEINAAVKSIINKYWE